MKEKILLYECNTQEKRATVVARIENGSLSVIGSEFYADSHPKAATNGLNEFFWQLDEKNTDKLSKMMNHTDASLLNNMRKNFNGPNACQQFKQFCIQNGIQPFLHFG